MHHVYIDMIIDAILEQYHSENYFYEEYLGVSTEEWQSWKNGQQTLTPEATQKIKNLFSDYEWMLLQKVLRQTILFPEKRNTAVAELRELKTTVAKKWISQGIGQIELVSGGKRKADQQDYIDLRATIDYGAWGYDDILNFRLPATIQPQLEGSKQELLAWVEENLAETYTGLEHGEDLHFHDQ